MDYLAKRFGISPQDASERLRLEQQVSDLALQVSSSDPAHFGGIFIEHQPVYKIIVLFTDAENRTSFRDTVAPDLRRFVQVRKAARNEQQNREITDQLLNSVKAAGVRALIEFDPHSQKFQVTVGSSSDRATATKAVPAELAPDILISVGDLPRDVQAGYVAGDYTYGGWPLYTTPNDPRCTTGFVVKMSDASYGVTTAGHCSTVNPSIWVNNHYVTLNPAVVWSNTGYYDFKVHPTGQLTVYGYVWYVNNQPIRGYESIVNSVSGYPNSGYFGIEDGLYRVTHVVGATMCKSGQRTGLSCGQIVSTNATYTTEDGVTRSGMIALGNSSQRVIGYSGDSGGPVFTPPTSGGTVRPAGSVSSVNGPTSGAPCDTTVYTGCQLYYMPIDRINDTQPMQVATMNGTVNP